MKCAPNKPLSGNARNTWSNMGQLSYKHTPIGIAHGKWTLLFFGSSKLIELCLSGESHGLVVKADGSRSRGHVYWINVSDARYYINTKIMKTKLAEWGTPQKKNLELCLKIYKISHFWLNFLIASLHLRSPKKFHFEIRTWIGYVEVAVSLHSQRCRVAFIYK